MLDTAPDLATRMVSPPSRRPSESGALYDIPVAIVAMTFFYGGILGVIVAQLLEGQLVAGMGFLSLLAVGFSEELAKPLGVLWLARRHEYAGELHGLVLGAAAGW